ncbi:MAG: hypothetical protein IK015_06300 [Treponema sp.]|nr:hypothetical protein [Treponema sp.]
MKKLILLFCVAFALVFASCKSTTQETDNGAASLVDGQIEGQEETSGDDANAEDAAKTASALEAAEAARQAAIEAGAKDAYGTAFAANDAAFEAIKALNDGKNHDAELADIKARYDALAAASKAKKLKERIDNEGLAVNAQSDYDAGEKALAEFDTLLAAAVTPGAALNKKATEAYNDYYAVYFKSYKKFANEERKNALAKKKEADAVKAQIARKNEYKASAEKIIKGDQQYSFSKPEEAYNSYKDATSSFDALAKDVAAKRAEAQKAIEEAKAKVAASNEYAAKADVEKPLGDEPVAGIEAEDTVLLEADQFENPDKEIINIDESVKEAN